MIKLHMFRVWVSLESYTMCFILTSLSNIYIMDGSKWYILGINRICKNSDDLLWIIWYVARNELFGLKWRYDGPKGGILDYWGTLIFCLLSYYILSMDKGS